MNGMPGHFTAVVGARITEFMAQMRRVRTTIRDSANDARIDIGADVSRFNYHMRMIRARIAALVRERVVIRIEARIQEFQNSINRIATNIRAFGELAQHTIQGALISLLPAVVPLISNVGVAIANLGPMIGAVAGSTFALVGAFASAGAGAAAFAAVAIPTISKLFDENVKLTKAQKQAKASFDAFKKTYDGIVKASEKPVLSAFQGAMTAANTILKALQPMFLSSAQAFANLMATFNTAIGTPPVQEFLQYLNTTAGPMLETFVRSFGNVFKGLGSMFVAFAPLSASTAKGFEEMTARFAEWANGLSASAKFQTFMDYVATNMPKVRAIFRDMTAGLIYFFSAFAGSSQGMMDGLVDMMARFKEWSATLSQNQGFQTFLAYVQQTAPSVLSLIGNLTSFLVNLGIGMAPLGATILVLINKFLEFANSMMENNRIIGVLIAGFISFGGIMLALLPNIIALSTLFRGLGGAITSGIGRAFTFIKPLFTSFSATMTRIAGVVLPKFGAALGFITSPVGLVIAAITALTAIFVGLYNTNETFRAQVLAVWAAIQTAISIAVTAVKDLIMSVWSQITAFWSANQESIMATASTVWSAIGTVVTTVMSAIGAIMQFIWPVVKALIISTWQAIQNVIQGVTAVILGIIKTFSSLFQGDWQGVWDGIKQILSGALQAVWGAINLYFVGKLLGPLKGFATTSKSIIQAAWTVIKSLFTSTLTAIKTLTTSVFTAIKTTITTIWTGISSFFTTILNAIKTTVTTVWGAIKSTITTILNGIKTTITTVWNAIKSVITDVLSGIRGIVTTMWGAIKSVISSVLSSIKAVVTTVWGAIKSVISSVLSSIKAIVTSVWNAIKTTTTTIISSIKSVVTSVWTGIKDIISTTMSTIKTVISTKWEEAKSFLTSINLISVGKDIIAGLISGITQKFSDVASALSSLTDKIPSWVKSALGIHSPSRVMITIAKWIPIGVAKGIESTTNVVKKAVNVMAKSAIPDFSKSLETTKTAMNNIDNIVKNATSGTSKEVIAIKKDFAKKRAELDRKSEQQIAVIKASASKKTQTSTKAQQQRMNNILADAAASREKLAKQEAEALAKVTSKSQAKLLDSLEQHVANKESLELWSTEQQASYWKYATTQFKANTDERIKAQNYYNKAVAELSKEQFDAEKNYIERKKQYNQLSLTQELEAYNKYLKQYKVGSEERIYYEDKVAETKKAIHEKLMSLNDEYVTKIAEAQQQEIDGIKELEKAYEDAVNNRASSLYSTVGIFDEIEEKAAASGEKLISNLRDQNEAFKDWAANVQELAVKGIDEGLLAELQAMGPSAAAEIAALNSLSASQLTDYVTLWQEKSSLARKQAETELTDMKLKTAKQIDEIHTKTETQLKTYEKEWATKIKEVRTGTEKQFNAMTATMPNIGRNIIKGMQQGLTDMSPQLFKQAQSIANNIKKTIQSALDIHSPSRWGKKMIGHNLVKGIIIGLADMKSDAVKAAEKVAEWIQPAVDVSDIINDISSAVNAIQTEIEHKLKVEVAVKGSSEGESGGNGVHQEVHLHSPKPLSPAENARQLKKVAQQLVYK